ncbi:hypothetical protein IUY40_18270, partial [Flavobacterium sp. ALJ2]|uniref:Calx-beta domain-containing protein n=1 Tax=Flavobacterium sp. ALJ2 TaxID=2786960 RepID=UPI001E4ED343
MKQKLITHLFLLLFSIVGFTQTGPGGVTDGLRIWLRPETGKTLSGYNVVKWADQSGLGIPNDFDQKNASVQPTIALAEAKYNFHPAVNFNGSKFMRSKVATEAPFDANITDATFFVVHNRTTFAGFGVKQPVFGFGDAPTGIDPGSNAVYPVIGGQVDDRRNDSIQKPYLRSAPYDFLGYDDLKQGMGESFVQGVLWSKNGYARKVGFGNSSMWNVGSKGSISSREFGANGAVLGSQKDAPYDGYIQEVIAYQKELSTSEILRIDSYLFVKYGIRCANIAKESVITDHYLDSGSNKIWTWDASAPGSSRFDANLAAIGRDDLSALNQKQSQSVKDGFQITIGLNTIAPTNAVNPGSFKQDRSFMFWGDNNKAAAFNTPIAGVASNRRYERVWRIQETGTVGTVKFAIPIATEEEAYGGVFLVRSTDETFDKSDEYIPLKKFTSGTTTYLACDVDFNNGDYFTLATNTDPEAIALSFTPTTATVAEGEKHIFTVGFPSGVTLDTDTVANFSITGTAINGTDYETIADSVTIPAGKNSVDINIQTIKELVIEENETIILTGTSVTSASDAIWTSGSANIATVTIADDMNNRELYFSSVAQDVQEGDRISIEVSLPWGVTAANDIKFTYAIEGSAISSNDYVPLTGTGTVIAGKNSADIVVSVNRDRVIELDETVILKGEAITAGSLTGFSWISNLGGDTCTLTIKDVSDPADKVLNFGVKKGGIIEGDTAYTKITLPDGVVMGYPLTVKYAVSEDSTADDNDYKPLSGEVTIGENFNSAKLEVVALTDNLIEPDETVILTGVPLEGFSWGSNNPFILTIRDPDPADKVLSFSSDRENLAEGEETIIKVSLPQGIAAVNDITFSYSVGGTAISGDDYVPLTGTGTIIAGQNSADIVVTALRNGVIGDSGATIILTGGVITAGSLIFTWNDKAKRCVVSIFDTTYEDDANIVLSISPDRVNVAEGESTTLTVSLPKGITLSSSIDIGDVGLDIYYEIAGSSTATAGDYFPLWGSAKLIPGSGTALIEVEAIRDNWIELDETLVITGSSGGQFTWSATANTATVTITDSNDKLLRFSPTTENVAEGSSTTLEVRLPEGVVAVNDITFSYSVGGTATSVDDYSALTGTGTIPAGVNSAEIVIDALMDSVIEDKETVILTGGVITAGSLTGFTWDDAAKEVTVTITDVTDPLKKVLNFSPTTAEVAEGSSTSIKVSLPEGVTLGDNLIVNYTVSGTATSDTDYIALTGSVTIPAGDSYAMIAVAALPDNLIEPDETVIITGGITPGFTWGSKNVHTVTIKDATGTDPAKNVLSISSPTESVAEGESTTIKISLPEGITVTSSMDINYKIAVSSTATAGADYKTLSGVATIPEGSGTALIEVETLLDKLIEADETIIITGVATAGFTWSTTANSATVTITDSNPLSDKVLRFSPTTEKIAEDSSTRLVVSLPKDITATNDIIFSFTLGGDATLVDDYVLMHELTAGVVIPPYTGRIAAGQNSTYIIIDAKTDTVIEDNETVIITGGIITAGSLTGFSWDDAAKEATVTITDVTPSVNKVLNFSRTTANVAEGDSTSINVSFPEGYTMGYPLTVNYIISDSSTATNALDYEELTGSVTIAKGSRSAEITIVAKNDDFIEPNETVIITGSTPPTGFTWGSDNETTVTIEDATGNDPAKNVLSISPLTA